MLNPLFEIPTLEKVPAKAAKEWQNKALKEQLAYLKENSTFYQKHFKNHKVNWSDIETINDLHKIPPIGKEELQAFNMDFLCVPKTKIIDYVTTSGTTGEPVTIALTEEDLQRLAYNEAISLAGANGKPEDIYQLTTTIDRRFMAGLAYYLGIRKLKCGIVRVGSGIPQLQLDTLERIQPNTLIAVPSFINALINYAQKNNIDLNQTSVKKIICIGESIRDVGLKPNALHKKIVEQWNVKLYSTYASTEMGTAYTECTAQQGGHEHPQLIISELLDENNQVLTAEDAEGELCITTLGVKGMPLLRFKTGDMVRFYHEKCSCGRTSKRVSAVLGRKNQMIKYKGTTLYPPAIFEVLNSIEEVQLYAVEVKKSELDTDEIIIHLYSKTQDTKRLETKCSELLRAKLRVKPKVVLTTKEAVQALHQQKNLRKPTVFVDNR